METGSGCQALGEGDWELVFTGERVSIWDGNVLEMDGVTVMRQCESP